MDGRIPPEFIDALLARTDIVDLINSRVSLRKAGKDYQACCPFHDEKTPSFTVSREKQFYYCFGCGAHGSAIGFLMEHDHQDFREAVEELAQQAGLEVPRKGDATRRGPDLAPLYDLLEKASTLYRRQLRLHPEAHQAVDYLKKRGLTGEIASTFGIGYAPPGWDFLLKAFGSSASERERLLKCGLIVEADGKRYDRFRNRVIFPIRDRRGRVIGFGGRLLGDGKPKYLNSPETPIFHKGRELYGLYEAQQAQRRLERVLVVEGYLDAIALAQFGIPYAVATLGTAATAEHLRLLLRTAPELVICFDGDRAGRAAAWKALETVLPLATGRQQVRFLFLPEGEDPDTLIRREEQAAFEQRVGAATPLSDFLFDHLADQVDLATTEGRARMASLAQPLLQQIPQSLYREMLSSRLAALIGVSPNAVGRNTRSRRGGPPTQTGRPSTLGQAIALVLENPALAPAAAEVPDDWRRLDNPGAQILARLLEISSAYPTINKGRLLEQLHDHEFYSRLRELSGASFLRNIPEEGIEAEFTDALKRLNAAVRRVEESNPLSRKSPSEWSREERELLEKMATAARTRS